MPTASETSEETSELMMPTVETSNRKTQGFDGNRIKTLLPNEKPPAETESKLCVEQTFSKVRQTDENRTCRTAERVLFSPETESKLLC